jgi:hypothetical protein
MYAARTIAQRWDMPVSDDQLAPMVRNIARASQS